MNHSTLSVNATVETENKLRAKSSSCRTFNSDFRLNISKSNSYVYPDLMVVCGEIEQPKETENAAMNPIIIVEVLSKSTAEYDRGDKFYLYSKIPTFKEYVLIDQYKHVVDVQYRVDSSSLWKFTRYEGLDKMIKLESISVKISMDDLYYNTVNIPTV